MMGQQQHTMVAGTTLRRMITVVAVAVLMALVTAASAMPAMAKNSRGPDGKPIMSGDITDANGGASVESHGSGGACVNHDGPKRSGHCT